MALVVSAPGLPALVGGYHHQRPKREGSLPQITERANSDILVRRELIQALYLRRTQRRKRATRMAVVELFQQCALAANPPRTEVLLLPGV
jgi:hypothetical protein